MRYHVLRFDIWLCLAIGVVLSFGTGKLARYFLESRYELYQQEHIVDKNEVGGIADETIFHARSIEDMMSHETFTVISPGIQYRNKGSGFYHNFYLHALWLPSSEIVAARINEDSVVHTGESIYSGDSILPVCKVVWADLTDYSTFLSQIEYNNPLSRRDFYLDCVGNASIPSEQDFIETPVILVELVTILLVFPIVHWLGSKFGLFPYIIPPRN